MTLPEEAVTETFAILGKRGVGQTTTARVLTEELLAVGLPVLVLDPTGVWWGLRASADGAGDGYPVVIFGGDHADVPLEETAGTLIADVLVEQRISAVLDLSLLSKSATRRFCTDLMERLYHRNREPLHVVIDEADMLAPQRVLAGGERLLGAISDLVRRGRVRGLGVTLITQRPATLNKDILTQAEVLIALRMTGPRDVAAIDEWVRLHADEDEARAVKDSLAALPVGTAWVWSPGWLDVLVKVNVRTPRTFDSSSTPRPGQVRPAAKRMAPVDLAALGAQITATVERAKAQDPKALRAEIAALRRELDLKPPEPEPEPTRVEVPVLGEADRALLKAATETWETSTEALRSVLDAIGAKLDAVDLSPPRPAATRTAPVPSKAAAAPPRARVAASATNPEQPVTLAKAQRAILSVLAQHGTRSTVQVALLTGYSSKSGGFRNALSSLRTAGFIDGRADVTATAAGVEALGPYDPLPIGADLVAWWKREQLGKAESAILDVLVAAWPAAVPVAVIAEKTGYSAVSGGFRNALSRLRSLQVASGRGELVVDDALMES